MDLYVVEYCGDSEWSRSTDSGVDIIFDSLEKAKNYVEEKSKEIMDNRNFDFYYYDHIFYDITKMKCNEPVPKEGTDVWIYNVRERRWTDCEEE